MTGPADLYKFKALLVPWDVRGLDTLAPYLLGKPWTSAWHDGDTFNALVSMGGRSYGLNHVRCAGYNAAELSTGAPGAAATTLARSLVDTGRIVYFDALAFERSDELDNFGRFLGVVTLADGRDLASLMTASGPV